MINDIATTSTVSVASAYYAKSVSVSNCSDLILVEPFLYFFHRRHTIKLHCMCEEIEKYVEMVCTLRDEMMTWKTPLEMWKELQKPLKLQPKLKPVTIKDRPRSSQVSDELQEDNNYLTSSLMLGLTTQSSPRYLAAKEQEQELRVIRNNLASIGNCAYCGVRLGYGSIYGKFRMCPKCMNKMGFTVAKLCGDSPPGSRLYYGEHWCEVRTTSPDGYTLLEQMDKQVPL